MRLTKRAHVNRAGNDVVGTTSALMRRRPCIAGPIVLRGEHAEALLKERDHMLNEALRERVFIRLRRSPRPAGLALTPTPPRATCAACTGAGAGFLPTVAPGSFRSRSPATPIASRSCWA
jgi:hypothetical protein